MNIVRTTNITVTGGMPFMPMYGGGMYPMGGCCGSIFGFGSCCSPMVNVPMAAGICTGAMLTSPYVLRGIGVAANWTYNHVLKPVGQFIWNNVFKPIGNGIKWVWDHTVGKIKEKRQARKAAKAE